VSSCLFLIELCFYTWKDAKDKRKTTLVDRLPIHFAATNTFEVSLSWKITVQFF